MDGVAYWEVRASCCSSYSTKVLHVKNREKIYAQEKTLMTKSICLSSWREKVAKIRVTLARRRRDWKRLNENSNDRLMRNSFRKRRSCFDESRCRIEHLKRRFLMRKANGGILSISKEHHKTTVLGTWLLLFLNGPFTATFFFIFVFSIQIQNSWYKTGLELGISDDRSDHCTYCL